jgi:hypothetical protein
MSKYQCLICTKNFKQKSQLDYHSNRINKCKPSINNPPTNAIDPPTNAISPRIDIIDPSNNAISPRIDIIDPSNNAISPRITNIKQNEHIPLQNKGIIANYSCEHCKKSFTRKDIVTKHMKKSCPIIKQQNKEKQDIFEKLLLLETKNKELDIEIKNRDEVIKNKDEVIKNKDELIKNKDEQYEEYIKKITNEPKILQSITINNNTINIINMVSHNEENLIEKKLDELMLILAAKKGYNAVEELILLVHFSSRYPEFQNIYIPDIKNKHVMIYDKEWKIKNANVAIKELYDAKSNFITENINVFFNRLSIREQVVFQRWITLISDKTTNEYKKYYGDMLETIKYTLYNNKDMVIATKKQSMLA